MSMKRIGRCMTVAVVALVASFFLMLAAPGQTSQVQAAGDCYVDSNGKVICPPLELAVEFWKWPCLSCPPELDFRTWIVLEAINERFEQVGIARFEDGRVARALMTNMREGRPQLSIFTDGETYRFALDQGYYAGDALRSIATLELPRSYGRTQVTMHGQVISRYR